MSTSTHVGPLAVTRYRAEGATGRVPCVVLAHGFGATQACGLAGFAEAFAAIGVEALTFDYRGFGESDGTPNVVSARAQLEDYRRVIDHARSLPEVDPDNVVVWGVSFAGGHVFQLAAEDRRLAGAIALTPATDGLAVVLDLVRREGLRPLLALSALGVRDRLARVRGRAHVMAPIAAEPGQAGALTAPGALEAYRSIAGPDWRNEVAAGVFLTLAIHRPGRFARRVHCPILAQIADQDRSVPPAASTRDAVAARAVIRRYACDHFDVYPGGIAHEDVVRDQVAFLQRTLGLERRAAPVAA